MCADRAAWQRLREESHPVIRPALTLRTLLAWGTIGIVATAILGAVGTLMLTTRLRDELEQSTEAVFQEEQIADRIVAAVHRQVLDATRHLQQPDPATLALFREDGDQAASDLTLYLFRPLSVSERLEVERIKEEHEALEVTAATAFNLASTGDSLAAQHRTQLLFQRASGLQASVDRFMAMRLDDRRRLQLRQAGVVRDLYLVVVLISVFLAMAMLLLLRGFQKRLLPRLNALGVASGAIAAGNYAARVSVGGADELAAVGASFNSMAQALQTARAELRARNDELAATVDRLRRTQKEVVQNEKLSALGGMLAGLAHELNNPLASVLGNAELLSARLHEHPGKDMKLIAEELADPIAHEALRARELIRNLLQMARQSEMAIESVSLNAALDVAVALRAYAFAQAGLRLEVNVQPDLWVRADRQRLQQAFLNIINNAFDALVTDGGSVLSIAAHGDGDSVVVVLQDDGPGLRDPQRIFDPFYTTKPVGSGTGLGLTIVHRFMEEVGGTIEATNAPEGGALFRLRIPAASPIREGEDRAAPAAAEPQGPQPAAPPLASASSAGHLAPGQNRVRVLVVEDEEPIRKLHRRILARLDADVLVACSGAEARDLLLEREVDLVVSDVKMPGEMDGVALFRWVCEERPALARRFLFVTGDAYDPVLLELARERPDRFITKPFQIDEYLQRLGSMLREGGPPPGSPV